MLSIIALTTLTSMTVTGCAKEKDEEKDEQNGASAGHASYHGGHGGHFAGSGAGTGAQSREKEYGRAKGGTRSSTNVKSSGYQAPPANAWGGVSRGWFGRFCGSVFGG